jgi:uncharacterized protein DUF6093
MPRFSTRTIAVVKRNVNEMLTETCTIRRETGARGTMGEPLHDSTEIVAQNVNCRVIRVGQRNRGQTMDVGAQETIVEMYRLICPVGTGFTTDDIITMSDGRVFQVVDVEDGLTDEAFTGAVMTRART